MVELEGVEPSTSAVQARRSKPSELQPHNIQSVIEKNFANNLGPYQSRDSTIRSINTLMGSILTHKNATL